MEEANANHQLVAERLDLIADAIYRIEHEKSISQLERKKLDNKMGTVERKTNERLDGFEKKSDVGMGCSAQMGRMLKSQEEVRAIWTRL